MAIDTRGINREARGLLSLFRAKVGGQAPRQFSDDVKLVVSELPFLAFPGAVNYTETASSANSSMSLSVPQTETWLLHHASAVIILSTATAATGAKLTLAMDNLPESPDSVSGSYLALDTTQVLHDGQTGTQYLNGVCRFTPPQPWLMQPGTLIQAVWQGNTTFTVNFNLFYTPLKI